MGNQSAECGKWKYLPATPTPFLQLKRCRPTTAACSQEMPGPRLWWLPRKPQRTEPNAKRASSRGPRTRLALARPWQSPRMTPTMTQTKPSEESLCVSCAKLPLQNPPSNTDQPGQPEQRSHGRVPTAAAPASPLRLGPRKVSVPCWACIGQCIGRFMDNSQRNRSEQSP